MISRYAGDDTALVFWQTIFKVCRIKQQQQGMLSQAKMLLGRIISDIVVE